MRVTGRANRMLAIALWRRDGGLCRRCHRPIDPTAHYTLPTALTIGHVLPLSRGGTNEPTNLGPEHRLCNLQAGDLIDPRAQALSLDPNAHHVSGVFLGRDRGNSSLLSARNGANIDYIAKRNSGGSPND